jgi:hypothetical protein
MRGVPARARAFVPTGGMTALAAQSAIEEIIGGMILRVMVEIAPGIMGRAMGATTFPAMDGIAGGAIGGAMGPRIRTAIGEITGRAIRRIAGQIIGRAIPLAI